MNLLVAERMIRNNNNRYIPCRIRLRYPRYPKSQQAEVEDPFHLPFEVEGTNGIVVEATRLPWDTTCIRGTSRRMLPLLQGSRPPILWLTFGAIPKESFELCASIAVDRKEEWWWWVRGLVWFVCVKSVTVLVPVLTHCLCFWRNSCVGFL